MRSRLRRGGKKKRKSREERGWRAEIPDRVGLENAVDFEYSGVRLKAHFAIYGRRRRSICAARNHRSRNDEGGRFFVETDEITYSCVYFSPMERNLPTMRRCIRPVARSSSRERTVISARKKIIAALSMPIAYTH